MKRYLVLFLLFFPVALSAQNKIRVACIGNSITFGAGLPNRQQTAWPSQLQTMLGEGYEVMNFGVSGTTALHSGGNAYIDTKQYQEAIKSNPAMVFIKLGTNDSRPFFRKYMDTFYIDYKELIRTFKGLPSHPRVIVLWPVARFTKKDSGVVLLNPDIPKLILPVIQKVAFEEQCEQIDLHSLFVNHAELFHDQLHPDTTGARMIAARVYEVIKANTTTDFDIFKKLKDSLTISSFYGYDCADFVFNGRNCKVVKPRRVAAGKPWIWRARFWGHEPQTDIALLDRGFHVVYCDVAELYGNKEAIGLWNKFYDYMHGNGLAKKVAMEGMSRGGVYVYNWAAENGSKVACVYADAPVLDLKSWPGGKGTSKGSKGDWEKFKADYGFTSEEEAMQFKGSPLDKVKQIVKGKFPMLHVVGDVDDVVPIAENTTLFEAQVKAAGGNITVIHKPGINHHPHSLPNPTPIVDFIVKATVQQ